MAKSPVPVAVAVPPRAKRVPCSVSQGINVGAEYTADEIEFMVSMDRYKRSRGRPWPTWKEVLNVLHSLGYRKVAEKAGLPQVPRPQHARSDQ